MRVLSASLLCLIVLAGASAQTAGKGKPVVNFNIELDLDKFPQKTPQEALGSVVKALADGRVDYVLAHLADPAFVQARLKDSGAHDACTRRAVETARLLADVATDPPPFLVLSDDNATDPIRTLNAGRITPNMGLTPAEWKTFTDGAMQVASSVLDQTGLRTVFHHHSAGYVETPDEIARFLDLTDATRIGLVFDTGHYCFGAGRSAAVEGLERFKERVWYVHLKDCHPGIANRVQAENLNYFDALRLGVFCELGRGCVDFPGVLRWLNENHYPGYVLVEQDVLPGMGTPKASALRNREYLRSIEPA